MKTISIHSYPSAMQEVYEYISGHVLRDDKRDIAIVLDREDILDFIKTVDSSLYKTVEIDTEGDYFYVTSSTAGSELFIENVRTEDGIKDHEGDILILPHYLPQVVRQACIDGSETVIEIVPESIYEKLIKIIEK